MNYFLITGAYRSGTTLLDKILDIHQDINVLSQPFPKLYRHLKHKFYETIGIFNKYYVLDDLFFPEYYPKDFLKFLRNHTVEKPELERIFQSMEGWSGQQTDFTNYKDFVVDYEPSKLNEIYKHFLRNSNIKNDNVLAGSKEILIEEFLPYFIEQNIKVILVIRDPRDVLTSLNVGSGTKYGGAHRPTLFHLRNWRKSIAIANTFKDNKNCLIIKYEDLLSNHELILKEVTDFLRASPFPQGSFNNGIKTKNGEVWKGNSSTDTHTGINSNNQGKYKKYLSANTIGYIEYLCRPEMLLYGYKPEISEYNPYSFKEPYKIDDNVGLNPKMSSANNEIYKELKRIKQLTKRNPTKENIQKIFYSQKNYEELSAAFQ